MTTPPFPEIPDLPVQAEACATCRFWMKHEGGNYGTCRRYPPVVVQRVSSDESSTHDHGPYLSSVVSMEEDARPAPRGDDWCGEYRRPPG